MPEAKCDQYFRSKNTKKSSEQKEDESHKEMETSDGGQGMFKHMKSIDDKVNQVCQG